MWETWDLFSADGHHILCVLPDINNLGLRIIMIHGISFVILTSRVLFCHSLQSAFPLVQPCGWQQIIILSWLFFDDQQWARPNWGDGRYVGRTTCCFGCLLNPHNHRNSTTNNPLIAKIAPFTLWLSRNFNSHKLFTYCISWYYSLKEIYTVSANSSLESCSKNRFYNRNIHKKRPISEYVI